MQSLVFDDHLRVEERAMPERAPHEALIRVRLAGICNTDIEITKGYMGFRGILGHEFVGEVVAADDVTMIGRRVVGEINCVPSDCTCNYCQMELPNHCAHRTVLGILNRNGAFATHLSLPVSNLYTVPDEVPDEAAVFTEPLAAAFRILEQIDIEPEHRVIVLGDGKLGLLIAQVLSKHSRAVTCVGRNSWKLELLRDLEIDTAHSDQPMERQSADVVVEVTGSAQGFERALELVRPEGTVILKTTVGHPTAFAMSVPVINEVRIIGSRCGPFRPALEALKKGDIAVEPLISETHPITNGVTAMQRAMQRDVLKVLLRPE